MKKILHRAAKIRNDGAVSAKCFASPHPIDLTRALWTIRDEAVTCPRCRRVMREEAEEMRAT